MNIVERWQITKKLREQFYCMDEDELRLYHAAAAHKIWNFVRENSPYYKKLYPAPCLLNEVAPMNRTIMMDQFNAINTAHLDRDTLVNFRIEMEKCGSGGYFSGYSIGLSSGTTGSRLLTVLSKKEREMYTCLLWARSGIPDRIKNRRVLFALRTYNPVFTAVSTFGVRIVYVDYFHPIEELIFLINKERLNILAGPPSLLLMLANQVNAIKHRIQALVSYAEILEDHAQVILESAFQAPAVQIYQGSEGFIGTTCRAGCIHINEDVLLIEPMDDPAKGPTKVLVTDLYRQTQPLIRYQLDDILEIDTLACSCGSVFRKIKRIHGRADEVFVLLGRDGQPRYLFPDYVRRAINQSSDAILEYQAIQHSPDQMEIRLCLKDEQAREQIQVEIMKGLESRVEKLGAELGTVEFSNLPPERNVNSNKLVRVTRKFSWKL